MGESKSWQNVLLSDIIPPKNTPRLINYGRTLYSPYVLVSNWNDWREADPKDFNPYCPRYGDQHISTYVRLGTDDEPQFTTTTFDMTEQVYTKIDPIYTKRPLVSFTSYPYTVTPERLRDLPESGLPQFSKMYGYESYDTTMQLSYKRPDVDFVSQPAVIITPPRLLNAKSYSPYVLVSKWNEWKEADPKDFNPYCPRYGNQHISTYVRLGTDDEPQFTTTTLEMTEQIHTKIDPVYTKKPLVSFTSYPCTDTPERLRDQPVSGLPQYSKNYGYESYDTTMQLSYKRPDLDGVVYQPAVIVTPPRLLNMKMKSDLNAPGPHAIPIGRGIQMFLDDEQIDPFADSRQLQNTMRAKRYVSYDAGTGRYTDEPPEPPPRPKDPCRKPGGGPII